VAFELRSGGIGWGTALAAGPEAAAERCVRQLPERAV